MSEGSDKKQARMAREVMSAMHATSSVRDQVEGALRAQALEVKQELEANMQPLSAEPDFDAGLDADDLKPLSLYRYDSFDEGSDEPRRCIWLISFTDIIALMLTFFVLLYSMSVPDVMKWHALAKEVEQGLYQHKTLSFHGGAQQGVSIQKLSSRKALDLRYLTQVLQREFNAHKALQNALIYKASDRLVVSLPLDLTFEVGQAQLSLAGRKAMSALGQILHNVGNQVELVGHADREAISAGGLYASNWALSLARAQRVGDALYQAGYKHDAYVRGVSNARYQFVDQTLEAQQRRAVARRVDIVIFPYAHK